MTPARVRALFAIHAAVLALFGSTTIARASHPLVDEGIARYEEADFMSALDAFARAERGDELTREDVIALLETRALVHFAQGDVPAMNRDLAQLASLDRAHVFSSRAPPEIVQAFDRARASVTAVTIDASARRRGGAVIVRVSMRGGATGLVRAMRIHHRDGAGAWAIDEGEETRIESTARVAYHVEAIGPGGLVIARVGTARSPRIVTEPIARASSGAQGRDGAHRRSSAFPVWPVVAGIGGAAAIATVIVVVVATSGGETLDRPSALMIE